MKQSKELDMIQEQMKPGVIAYSGFLGSDDRNLGDILEADDAAVRRMGLTHKAIAAKLRDLMESGKKGLGTPVEAGELEVRVDGARGQSPCPFLHKGLYHKTFAIVRNRRTGTEFTFSELNIHMIEVHGFYEGLKSLYRLEPEMLARELSLL